MALHLTWVVRYLDLRLKEGLGTEGLIMAGAGDYMLDLIWADQPPSWVPEENPCP